MPKNSLLLAILGEKMQHTNAWVCQMVQGNRICGKIGSHTNFRSFVGFSQSKHYGVIVLLNTGSGENNGLVKIPSVSQIGVNLIKNTP